MHIMIIIVMTIDPGEMLRSESWLRIWIIFSLDSAKSAQTPHGRQRLHPNVQTSPHLQTLQLCSQEVCKSWGVFQTYISSSPQGPSNGLSADFPKVYLQSGLEWTSLIYISQFIAIWTLRYRTPYKCVKQLFYWNLLEKCMLEIILTTL